MTDAGWRWSRLMAGRAIVLALVLTGPVVAQTPSPLERARLMSASPDTPLFSFAHRGSLRATLGGELPVVGARGRDPMTLQVVPFIELHNRRGSDVLLPNEQWRGRLAVEMWRTESAGVLPWEVGLAVEHESDHDTARGDSDYRFLGLNDVAARGLVVVPLGSVALSVSGDLRLMVWSCNRLATPCADFEGATTLGAALGIVADLRATASGGWRPFLAVDLSGLVAQDSVAAERRVVGQAGIWTLSRRAMWQLVVMGLAGNEVGMRRTSVSGEAGVGVRFGWFP